MSTKNIIISLVGVIIIGGAVYFSMANKKVNTPVNEPPVTTSNVELKTEDTAITEPTKDTSTDEIIDYLVDGQSKEETKAAQAVLEATSTTATEPTISTNF